MIKGKKILIVLMAMALMVFGASSIYAAEGDSDTTSLPESEYNAGMVTLESVLGLHPDTQNLYAEYQEEIAVTEDETAFAELKQKYISLVKDKIQSDLDQFASSLGLDVLLINNTIVSGNIDLNSEDLSNVVDVTPDFEAYLTESSSTTSATVE